MSDEIEQTIEELEAEVLAELEEASEKPLGKAIDLGLGSNNADETVSNAKKPAPKVAGADNAESVEGEKAQDLGGAKPEASVEKGADEDRSEKEIGKKASAKASATKDAQNKGAKQEPKVKQGSSGEATPGESQKLAASHVPEGDEVLEEAPKLTKAQHIENIAKMKKGDIEEMLAAHTSKLAEADNAESEEELAKLKAAKEEIEEKIKNINVKEDVDALVDGEDLSEEFKAKAATIFEAAVKSKIRSEVERIVEESASQKDAEVDTFKEEMTDKVDTYLNYVVEEWTKENELAIERGLKGEIAEDFISGLKQLFEDHYIDVPDEKYDVLEAQSEKISELESRLNEEIEKNVQSSTKTNDLVRESVISEVSVDLADTEIEKFKSLTADVEFTSEEAFKEKLNTLKESYFPKQDQASDVTTLNYEEESTAQDIDTTDSMRKYMSAISRDQKASA